MALVSNPMRKSGRPIVAFLGLLLSGLTGSYAEELRHEPNSASDRGDESRRTQVVVLATQHFLTDMPTGYTPGHLRALLHKTSPAVLAVEAPSNAPDPWGLAPYELWNVTRPWADKHGVPVVPCGWLTPDYSAQLGRMFQQYRTSGKLAQYQQTEMQFQAKAAAMPSTCQSMNSSEYHTLWRTYHEELHNLLEADTPWEEWNSRILLNVKKLCREHPGERVVVVFGAAHGYYLIDKLSADEHVEVLPAQDFLPQSADEVADHTYRVDYLKALRPLNFGQVAPAQLKHAEKLLVKLSQWPEFKNDYRLFHGKLLQHQGDLQQAQAEFELLSQAPSDEVSQFDDKSLLAEAGAVYAAITLSQMGKLAEARERFEAIIANQATSHETRDWVKQMLASMPVHDDSS